MGEKTATAGQVSKTAGGSEGNNAFKPITTQEEYDKIAAAIRHNAVSKYENFETYKAAFEELEATKEAQKTELEKAKEQAAKFQAQVKAYENAAKVSAWKHEIAAQTGVDVRLLHGETEDAIKKCAEEVAQIIGGGSALPITAKPVLNSDGSSGAFGSAGDYTALAKQVFG